jgi:uncharacterized protein (TIGR02996 family)
MSDENALLAAIWEHPHEDTPRLMYADWLQEHGQPERAEFVRVQCELARLDGDDPRFDALEARAEGMLAAHGKGWWKAMPPGARRGHFDRGFPVPNLGQFTLPGLIKLGESKLRAAPLWRYHYGVHGSDLGTLVGWRFLHRLELFALRAPLPDRWAERLAGCPNARNVSELVLMDSAIAAGELALLLGAWADRSLRDLNLELDADGVRVLADHPTAANLRGLRLVGSKLTAVEIRTLTRSRHLTRLQSLSVAFNAFGDEGLAELLRWPGLRKLRGLHLDQTAITTSGAEALAACPAATNLRQLWLSGNRIGAAGALAVATSPHLANLTRVSFYNTPALRVPEVETALRKRFGRGQY